jgi:hypothetical protein
MTTTVLQVLILVLFFVLLTPGILVTLPPKSGKLTVAITHGVVFALLYVVLGQGVRKLFNSIGIEGLEDKKEEEEKKQ